jgi:hypothetical protein
LKKGGVVGFFLGASALRQCAYLSVQWKQKSLKSENFLKVLQHKIGSKASVKQYEMFKSHSVLLLHNMPTI